MVFFQSFQWWELECYILIQFIVKFLQDKKKYRKRRAKILADISARLFMVTYNKSLKYTNTQRLNCRCQELDLTYLTVSLVPTWWIFTPPSEFLPHLENFIPNPTNVRNMLTFASTNILVGRKILPPSESVPSKKLPPSKNVLIRVIRVNFTFWKILMSPIRFELQNFYPMG